MKKQGLFTELWRARMVRIWIAATALLIVIGLAALVVIVRPGQKDASAIPQAIIQVADFTPYFYPDGIPGGFEVNKSSVSLARGVLYIRMTNHKNQSITMTEQRLPVDLINRSLSGKSLDAPGQAVMTTSQGRTTATLFTKDNETMILIDTSGQIEHNKIEELVKALQPLH